MLGQITVACSKARTAVETGTSITTNLIAYSVQALAIDPVTPTTLYAGTDGGVFKSTNGGGNWNAVNTGLSDTYVAALAIDPSTPTTLYAGTYGAAYSKAPTVVKTGMPSTPV